METKHQEMYVNIIGYILWGMGMATAFAIIAVYLNRLILHGLPPKAVANSVWASLCVEIKRRVRCSKRDDYRTGHTRSHRPGRQRDHVARTPHGGASVSASAWLVSQRAGRVDAAVTTWMVGRTCHRFGLPVQAPRSTGSPARL